MHDLTTLHERTQLGAWLNEHGLVGQMVEVGVAFGGYAAQVLEKWHGSVYWLVDPWEEQPKDVYKERTDGIPYESWFQQCIELAARDKRVRVLREYSVNAAALFPDNSLDCVYIDGNHCREAVEADLSAWWPKLKRGGILGAHDFYDAKTDGHYCEVKSAISEWEVRAQLQSHVTPCSSWWTIKP